MATEAPIFVIGAQRSGTTMLRLMLTAHRDICIPPESLFFVTLEKKYGEKADLRGEIEDFLTDLYADKKFLEWGVDRDCLRQRLSSSNSLNYAEAVATVYRAYMQEHGLGRWWGDKNPDHIFHVDTILHYFPNARVIVIVRDVRAIYSSLKTIAAKRFWHHLKMNYRVDTILATRQWQQALKVIENGPHSGQFYAVHYEELVTDSEAQLRAICAWLGVEFDEAMPHFHQKNLEMQLVPESQYRWQSRTFQPLSCDRIDAWQHELSLSEIEALELMNQRKMQQLGYRCLTRGWRGRGRLRILREYVELVSLEAAFRVKRLAYLTLRHFHEDPKALIIGFLRRFSWQ